MRVSEHLFVRDTAPLDLSACRHCGWPEYFCLCDPEEDELPAYAGSDPQLYRKESH